MQVAARMNRRRHQRSIANMYSPDLIGHPKRLKSMKKGMRIETLEIALHDSKSILMPKLYRRSARENTADSACEELTRIRRIELRESTEAGKSIAGTEKKLSSWAGQNVALSNPLKRTSAEGSIQLSWNRAFPRFASTPSEIQRCVCETGRPLVRALETPRV